MADQKPALATPEEVAGRRADIVKEYGTYVALAPIAFNGALAYNAGDSVPASNVEKFDYLGQGLVAKLGTKAANETINALIAQADGPGLAEPTVSLAVPVPEAK